MPKKSTTTKPVSSKKRKTSKDYLEDNAPPPESPPGMPEVGEVIQLDDLPTVEYREEQKKVTEDEFFAAWPIDPEFVTPVADESNSEQTSQEQQPETEMPSRAVQRLNALGITITATQFHLLDNDQMRLVSQWVSDTESGLTRALPVCLLPYAPNHQAAPSHQIIGEMVPVTFGGFSSGEETMRLGVRVSRQSLNLGTANELFCCRTLKLELALGNPASGQMNLPGMEGDRPCVVVDVTSKSFAVKKNYFTAGLTMNLDRENALEVMRFTKRNGVMTVHAISDLKEEDDHCSAGSAAKGTQAESIDPDDEDDTEFPDDDEPGVAPVAGTIEPGDKLYLCDEQLVASLGLIGLRPLISGMTVISEWSDEQRDEVDEWAKTVAMQVATQAPELTQPPLCISEINLEVWQGSEVSWQEVAKSVVVLYALVDPDEGLDYRMPADAGDFEAAKLDIKHSEVPLVGFYKDEWCDRFGNYPSLPSKEEWFLFKPGSSPLADSLLRVHQCQDGFWRAKVGIQGIPGEIEQRINIRQLGYDEDWKAAAHAIAEFRTLLAKHNEAYWAEITDLDAVMVKLHESESSTETLRDINIVPAGTEGDE
jgi:hypothetical protein